MRYESDSMGRVAVADDALYGAQTQRAIDNFTISTRPMPDRFIYMLALIKAAAARANLACGALDAARAGNIERAALR